MVKIEQLKSAKAVFTRNNNEQPVVLNSTLTDEEFKTMRVLEGIVVVSIDEIMVLNVTAKETPTSKTVIVESVAVVLPEEPKVDLEPKSPSGPTVVATSQKITTPVKPLIVKPVPRTRK